MKRLGREVNVKVIKKKLSLFSCFRKFKLKFNFIWQKNWKSKNRKLKEEYETVKLIQKQRNRNWEIKGDVILCRNFIEKKNDK